MMASIARRVVRGACGMMAMAVLAACSAKVTAPPEPPVAVRRGDQDFRYKEYDAAIQAYRIYLDEVDHGEYTPRVFYKTALAQYRLERYQATLQTLDELSERYPTNHWVQAEALRGDVERVSGHTVNAIQAWDAAWNVGSEADRRKLRPRIMAAARELNDVDLTRARRAVNTRDVRKLLDGQIASRQPAAVEEPMPPLDEAEPGEEQTAKAEAVGLPPVAKGSAEHSSPTKPILANLEPETGPADDKSAPAETAGAKLAAPKADELATVPPSQLHEPAIAEPAPAGFEPLLPDKPVGGPAKIGCLLPLSGAAQRFGERSLRGVRLVFGQDSDALVVKDTGGDPEAASRMFEELSNDPSVLAVIGPLRGEDAVAVAPLAERVRLPLLLLSPRDRLDGTFALQAGMTRSGQVRTLLDYAIDKVRLRRFGVVYPNDPYGKEFLSAFRSEVERRGGAMVGIDAYPPTAKSLTAEVGTVRKWREAGNVEAVFLPDTAVMAGKFAAELQRQMPDITLLGVHGWESLADHSNLNGILFTDGFYAGSARAETREFVEHFQQIYDGQTPGVLEAQAYDAALLSQRALAAGAHSRSELLSRMRELGSIAGASGDLRLTPAGLQRSLFLLQVYDGQLKEISANAG